MRFGRFPQMLFAAAASLGCVCSNAFASEAGHVAIDESPEARDLPFRYELSFLKSQNVHENRIHHGLMTQEEEQRYFLVRSAEAAQAVRGVATAQLHHFTQSFRTMLEHDPSPVIRSAAIAVAMTAAVYAGETFRWTVAEGLVLAARTAFSTRGGYFASLNYGRFGLQWSRAMLSTEQSAGMFAWIPGIEIQSSIGCAQDGSVRSSLSKTIAKGLNLSLGHATHGSRSPAAAHVHMGYGVSF